MSRRSESPGGPAERYLDHAAAAPLAPRARARMIEAMERPLGNPSSPHAAGRRARAILEEARRAVAAFCGAGRARLVFTGSGTEANRIALFGLAALAGAKVLVRSAAEHPGVAAAAARLAAGGCEERLLPVDRAGRVDPAACRAPFTGAGVVAVQWANGDLGGVNDIRRLAVKASRRGARFHTDAAQALGRTDLRFDESAADTLAVASAKIGGPGGIGALLIKRGVKLPPELPGAAQEGGLRAGTEAVILAAGFAGAVEDAALRAGRRGEVRRLRDGLLERLRRDVPEARLLAPPAGDGGAELGDVASVVIPGADGGHLAMFLDLAGVCVGRGPACRAAAHEPSPSYLAAGLTPKEAASTLRVSLGAENTPEDVEAFVAALRAFLDGPGRGAP